MAASGTGQVEQILNMPGRDFYPTSWSSDETRLVATSNADVGFIAMDSDRSWNPLLAEEYAEWDATISPNGRWMAYGSRESGRSEIYARPFPDVEKDRVQISDGGGDDARWSPDGRELYYRTSPPTSVMVVPVTSEPAFAAGISEVLFEDIYYSSGNINWDVAPNGRFLMIKEEAPEDVRQINIVRNWVEELKARVPTE